MEETEQISQPKVNLWEMAMQQEQSQVQEKNLDKTIIVVGDKKVGKTAFINILQSQQQAERYAPTSGIEYSYIRKTTNFRKELIHAYEIGGGRDTKSMITLPITKQNYQNIVFIIVVDLSATYNLLESLNFWIGAIREQADIALNRILEKNEQQINSFKYQQLIPFEQHEDKNRIDPLPFPAIVIGSKYDKYEKFDVENRKWISRGLRFLSHNGGCSLYFASSQNMQLQNAMKNVFFLNIFGQKRSNILQVDHIKPIMVFSGSDQQATMNLPAKGYQGNFDQFQKIIRDNCQESEIKEAQKQQIQVIDFIDKYPEMKIDSIRLEKEQQMKKVDDQASSEQTKDANQIPQSQQVPQQKSKEKQKITHQMMKDFQDQQANEQINSNNSNIINNIQDTDNSKNLQNTNNSNPVNFNTQDTSNSQLQQIQTNPASKPLKQARHKYGQQQLDQVQTQNNNNNNNNNNLTQLPKKNIIGKGQGSLLGNLPQLN